MASYLDSYYRAIKAEISAFACADEAECICRGRGWIVTDLDTAEECPCHRGRRHPEDDSPVGSFPGEKGYVAPVAAAPVEVAPVVARFEDGEEIPF